MPSAVQRAVGVRRKKWWVGFWEDDCRGPEESGRACGRGGRGIGPCQKSVLSPGRTGEVFMILFPGGGDGWRQAGAWRADGAVR